MPSKRMCSSVHSALPDFPPELVYIIFQYAQGVRLLDPIDAFQAYD